MIIQSWQNILDLIRNGEPVTAEVANRAIFQLAQRTEHLKTRQDANDYAQAIFVADAPLTVDVKTGHAVYFDKISNKFAPAYAEMIFKDGYLCLNEASAVVGIVVNKNTADSGVIVVEGLINPTEYTGIDCTGDDMTANMILDQNDRGLLYLSSGFANAGSLMSKPGILSVPVCHLFDSKHLLVRPPISYALDTQALKFNLYSRPATPELILQRIAGSTPENFPVPPLIGTEMRLVSVTSDNPDGDPIATYLTATVHKINGSKISLINVEVSKHLVELLGSAEHIGDYQEVMTAPDGKELVLKHMNSLEGIRISYSSPSISSYVSVINNDDIDYGHAIDVNYVDKNLPGWLPATSTYFPDVQIPAGARYGYNFAADSNLNQLFPEGVFGTYVVFKDGQAVSPQVVSTSSNAIWWFDSFNELPWGKLGHYPGDRHILPNTNITYTDWSLNNALNIIKPTQLTLVYTKLVNGGIKVVTSLETDPDSPLSITDPQGNPATTGPLKLSAGFTLTNPSNSETGAIVVKSITGFAMKRGPVVEKIVAGENIQLSSTLPNGQGNVTVSVSGLDGKLEGQPDILAIDDILIEKDGSLPIFYSVMPQGKNSSILGKVDVPSLIQGNYNLKLIINFIALHNTGCITPPVLTLSWILIKGPVEGEQYSLVSGNNTPVFGELQGGLAPFNGNCVDPRTTFMREVSTASVSPRSTVFFKLARNSLNGDFYPKGLAILSIKYRLEKITV
jgi:hypothetical protein